MNKIVLLITLLLSLPLTLAWDQEECEVVHWDHPDCAWGAPTPSSSGHVSEGRSGHQSSFQWVVTGISTNSTHACASMYLERKSLFNETQFVPTSVSAVDCLPLKVYEHYPGLFGVY